MPLWKKSSWPSAPGRTITRCRRTSAPSGCVRSANSSPTRPACSCSGTRRSSAKTPSPTRPASTSTACSRSGPPTRSCARRTSASPARPLFSANTAADTRSVIASPNSVTNWTTPTSSRPSPTSPLSPTRRRTSTTPTSWPLWRNVRPNLKTTGSSSACTLRRTARSPHHHLAPPRKDETVKIDAATGDGPIDAAFNTLERITGVSARLQIIRSAASPWGRKRKGGPCGNRPQQRHPPRQGNQHRHHRGECPRLFESPQPRRPHEPSRPAGQPETGVDFSAPPKVGVRFEAGTLANCRAFRSRRVAENSKSAWIFGLTQRRGDAEQDKSFASPRLCVRTKTLSFAVFTATARGIAQLLGSGFQTLWA